MAEKKGSKKPKFSRGKKTTLADGGGLRFNTGKNRLDLVPPEWFWALADVTTKGTEKGYPERNWERGMKWGTCLACALRHIFKFACGERYDGVFDIKKGTTGCHHLAMAAWNVLALMTYDLRGIGENDIPKSDIAILARVNAAGDQDAGHSSSNRK